ncbi:MAG: hypothetical protein JSU04_01985 [Bdellovibrionales bacterium]|nr:hypothetical protein [Bdellovibrionales bacterium]
MSFVFFKKRTASQLRTKHGYPSDVADILYEYLMRVGRKRVNRSALRKILEVCFFASMRTEEGKEISFTVVYANPKSPDPLPPKRVRPHRWTFVSFKDKSPFNIKNIVKLSSAINPAFSAVAVFVDKSGTPIIWGATDQEVVYRRSVNHDRSGSFGRPGIFQVEVEGPGIISVYDGNVLVTTLRNQSIVSEFHNVFEEGPIFKKLVPYIQDFAIKVHSRIEKQSIDLEYDWIPDIRDAWLSVFRKVLLQIRRTRHGGAIILNPTNRKANLHIKYDLRYDRLNKNLQDKVFNYILRNEYAEEVHHRYTSQDSNAMPVSLYLNESVANDAYEDNQEAEIGCLNFISSMSRVDGAILLSKGLITSGFGVEIRERREAKSVYLASKSDPKARHLKKLDPTQFGTRHRSMIRYCYYNPSAVGFVISQDGDVRVMTRVGSKLLVWENIQVEDIISGRDPIELD